MSIEQFIVQFRDTIQADAVSISPETRLNDIVEFDSMGRLSVMAMLDTRFGFIAQAEQLDRCETVRDLFAFASARRATS